MFIDIWYCSVSISRKTLNIYCLTTALCAVSKIHQSGQKLIIRSNSSAVDFALLKDGKLIELNREVDNNKFSVGDIYAAKIRKPISGLNAAFVSVGHKKDGFLHYHDLGPNLSTLLKYFKQVSSGRIKDYSLKNFVSKKKYPKTDLYRIICSPNNKFLSRLSKNQFPLRDQVSSELSLAEDSWCLFPFQIAFQFHKKSRAILKKILKNWSKAFDQRIWYNHQNRREDQKVKELDSDLQQLLGRWKNLCEKFVKVDQYPNKILSEINRSSSILRDIFDNDFTGIHVDDPEMRQEIMDYLKTIAPNKVSIVKYFKNKSTPIFDHFGIEGKSKPHLAQLYRCKKVHIWSSNTPRRCM